jgi:hypothetical protein
LFRDTGKEEDVVDLGGRGETRRGGFIVPQPGRGSLFLEKNRNKRRQDGKNLEIDRIDCLIPNSEILDLI